MPVNSPRESFKNILQGEECIFPASVFDPISSRMALDLGFEVGMFAGSIASAVVLGSPDYILLTLSEFAEQSRRICRASDLPLMVDADHGYGNALNVSRTIEELENSGVSAITIEDTKLPITFNETSQGLISLDEGKGKINAALYARKDSHLSIIARTSAVSIDSLAEGINRAKEYEKLGADGIFFTGITKTEELKEIYSEIKVPILLGNLSEEISNKTFLSSVGVKIALQGHLPFYAGIKSVYETMKSLKNGVDPKELKTNILPTDQINKLINSEEFNQKIKKFL
tara:strand:+ start:563 stop:1420 length:858 start_codon:yes stop_codon:yes gene_type:complete